LIDLNIQLSLHFLHTLADMLCSYQLADDVTVIVTHGTPDADGSTSVSQQ